MTQRAELLTRFVEELRREGTRTDTGAVSLEDPVDLADLSWSDAETPYSSLRRLYCSR